MQHRWEVDPLSKHHDDRFKLVVSHAARIANDWSLSLLFVFLVLCVCWLYSDFLCQQFTAKWPDFPHTKQLPFDDLVLLPLTVLNKQKDLNKIDESDETLIEACIDLEVIDKSNVKNVKDFLTSVSLDDLKVLRNIIDNLPKQYGDILINNDIWDKYEIKLLGKEKEAIASILKQDKYTLCK